MEDKIYELVRNIYFGSSYEEIVNALKLTLEYFDIEEDIYKKRRIVKYWGDKFGNFVMVEIFNRFEKKDYRIFTPEKSAVMNAAYYFSSLKDIRDFKKMAKEIIKIYDEEIIDGDNSLITEEEVREAIELVENKVPLFKEENIFDRTYIFLHNKENIKFNSYVLPDFRETNNRYFINCFKMQQENINPVYVFLHELGHVLLCEIMQKSNEVPFSFYELSKNIIDINDIESKEEMVEMFCELFATTMMLGTKYEKYCPYQLDEYEKYTLSRYFRTIMYHLDNYDSYMDLNRYYKTLEKKVEKEGQKSVLDLSADEFKQLAVVENTGQGMLDRLFIEKQSKIVDEREKIIGSVKYNYYDFEYFIRMYIASSNFLNSIQLLELLRARRVKEVYEINYQNKMQYKRKFFVTEEIARQQEILVYNLEHPNNKKETLDDEMDKIISRMYKRGEISDQYFEMHSIPDKTIALDNLKRLVAKYDKNKLQNNSVFVKLEGFKNHESKPIKNKRSNGNKDYLKQYINQQKSGTSGEDFAYEQEKIRLKDYPHLLEKIIPYYKTEPGKGYDILSFEIDGQEKHIEVKSSSTNNSDKKIHFFISDNEDEFLRKNPNACIYYVYNFKNKKIREIKREQYLEMKKTPRLFEVDIDCE